MSQVEERLDFESMWETITNNLDGAGANALATATVVHQPEAPAIEALTEVEDDSEFAASSHDDEDERARLIGLVEKAREGDSEAFGQLYDHYQPSVYRFLYYRVGSAHLAEDLTADTFFRALRSVSTFRWQGKDFGAWLMTIARNLSTDHFKSSRTRLEAPSDDLGTFDAALPSPENDVLTTLSNETLLSALKELPTEQRECIVMRFLQGLSIAETADALGRSSGAIKQLQLRGVRNLAKHLPVDLRP